MLKSKISWVKNIDKIDEIFDSIENKNIILALDGNSFDYINNFLKDDW